MTKIRDYDMWEEDFYDPNARNVDEIARRGKKKKSVQAADFKEKYYEEEEG